MPPIDASLNVPLAVDPGRTAYNALFAAAQMIRLEHSSAWSMRGESAHAEPRCDQVRGPSIEI